MSQRRTTPDEDASRKLLAWLVREARLCHGITQAELARRMFISEKHVAAVEAQQRAFSFRLFAKCVRVMGCRIVIQNELTQAQLTSPLELVDSIRHDVDQLRHMLSRGRHSGE